MPSCAKRHGNWHWHRIAPTPKIHLRLTIKLLQSSKPSGLEGGCIDDESILARVLQWALRFGMPTCILFTSALFFIP